MSRVASCAHGPLFIFLCFLLSTRCVLFPLFYPTHTPWGTLTAALNLRNSAENSNLSNNAENSNLRNSAKNSNLRNSNLRNSSESSN
ncbi:hypothetical protein EDD21DRAFT_365340 [Dissophora ornata]|nr:hypothetical protein EDD21DRAFT_365340 [Dissophora ornata]